tara:strand:- start:57 stop:1493 length:1437 start_codon:yes stop_codon:yes gene_type:complete
MAYTLIETITVDSGGASSIEFDSIEAVDGADLKVLISARSNASGVATEYRFQFNGDTSSVYYTTGVAGDGSTINNRSAGPTSFLENLSLQKNGATANTFGNGELYISNFSSAQDTVASFTAVSENNASEAYQGMAAFLRDVAEAITSIKIYATVGDFMEHTTASLYLVTAADASGASTPSPSATGGSISISGGYWYHTFTSSGTFTPTTTLSCDYVVVGGGGGGWVGGGGGGNVVTGSDSAMNTAGKTVTIGSGGAGGRGSGGSGCGGSDYYPYATNGGQSELVTTNNGTITGGGGGYGGADFGGRNAGASGGSGGGGVITGTGTQAGASGNGTNANSGGTGVRYSGNNSFRAGGGGGAGGTPATPSSSDIIAGDGGAGYTWLNGVTYAGGGGGSGGMFSGLSVTGGDGAAGGGDGASLTKVSDISVTRVATSGQAGTGSGGGGGPYGSSINNFYPNTCDLLTGGAGGSGIVIIRYAV